MILPHLPERESMPRQKGITMVMDKGLSMAQAENMMHAAGHLTDFVKLGFGTSVVSKNVSQKVKLYQSFGVKVYLGGTLLEACLVRNALDQYEKFLDETGVDCVEVSDGSISMEHEKKLELINRFSQQRIVLSEVGAKEADVIINPIVWIEHINSEIEAGSHYVIAEARESGTVGIYNTTGKADKELIMQIISKTPNHKVLWEAPLKSQQVWFIKLLGPHVNLGNIAPSDIIPLETLRLGLRGDTFFDVLPPELHKYKLK